MHRVVTHTWIASLALALAACGGSTENLDVPTFAAFVDGAKSDAAFISDRALGLEAELEGRVYLSLAHLPAADLSNALERAEQDPAAWFADRVSEQFRYAQPGLKRSHYKMNLQRGEPRFLGVERQGTGVWATYRVTVDSLVKVRDLEAAGLSGSDLSGARLDLLLPADPARIYAIGGAACASAEARSTLNEINYAHYFDPEQPGCALEAGAQLVVASFEVRSTSAPATAFPEYDRLVADGWLTAAVVFAAGDGDEADVAWQEFSRDLLRVGFKRSDQLLLGHGERFLRDYGELKVQVDVFSPAALGADRSAAERDLVLGSALATAELVYLNGPVIAADDALLAQSELYPADTYQILILDASWGYALQSRQVFSAKAKAGDASGMLDADVVVNTEPAVFGGHKTTFELMRNLFAGAAAVRAGAAAWDFSWNNLMAYANLAADLRARFYGLQAEVYGVAGAGDNCWDPQGSACRAGEEQGTPRRYQRDVYRDIPDDDAAGVSSTIRVEELFAVAEVRVEVDLVHSYPGDLSVVLKRGAEKVVLFDRQADPVALGRAFVPADFTGASSAGDWTLTVADHSPLDTGEFRAWTLTLVPAHP